jgi:hypothetical protein
MADYDKYQKDIEELGFDFLDLSIDLRSYPELASKLTKEQRRLRQSKVYKKYMSSGTNIKAKRKQYEEDIIKMREILRQKGVITKEDAAQIISLKLEPF